MKKRLLMFMISVCMVTTLAPIGILAIEEGLNEPLIQTEEIQDNEIDSTPEMAEQEVEETNIENDEEQVETKDEEESSAASSSPLIQTSGFSLLNPRAIGTEFTSKMGEDTLRYTVLTEDPVSKTGTVKIGWSSSTGPTGGGSTNGNATAVALKNKNLVLPQTVMNNGITYTLTTLGKVSLASLQLDSITLPKTVTTFDQGCLRQNNFKSLTIPEGVTTIDMGAFSSDKLEVIKFPSTITHLAGSVLTKTLNPNLKNIYFPVDHDITKIGTSGTTPIYDFDWTEVSVICDTKEQYEKWKKDTTVFWNLNDAIFQSVTYEMEMEFYDRDGKRLTFENPYKKLYGKDISFELNDEGVWKQQWKSYSDWGTIQDLPTLPSASELGYTANYWCLNALGIVTVNKDGKIEYSKTQGALLYSQSGTSGMRIMRVFTKEMYAVEEQLEVTLNKDSEKAYDGESALGISINRNDAALAPFLENNPQYLVSYTVEEATNSARSKSTKVLKNKADSPIKNVADSGEYVTALTVRDYKNLGNSYQWGTPFTGWGVGNSTMPASIKINPAEIDFDFDVDDIIWNNQTSLPEITLNREDHGADGKIVWDLNQTPQKGTHSYNFNFIPSDATGTKATNTSIKADNYKTKTKSGAVEITYKEIKYFDVSFIGINGSVIDRQSIEEGKSALAPTAPNVSGYKFVGWDKSFDNVLSTLMINAIYEKLPDEKPSGGGTPVIPPVNRPVNPPVNTSNSEPVIAEEKEEDKDNRKNVVENKKEGIKIETSNKDKIFKSDAEVVVVDASKQEKKKAKQKLDDIIKVLEVVIKEDGVKVERTLDSKFKIYLDAKEYKNVKNLKVWQKTKDGDYKSLPYEIQDGQIVFECDALDTYVLTGKKEKVVIKENDDFPWWIIPLIVAGAGIAFYAYKKSKKESE